MFALRERRGTWDRKSTGRTGTEVTRPREEVVRRWRRW